MRFVIKFRSAPARDHFESEIRYHLGDSPFVIIKQSKATVPTLIVVTKRDDAMFVGPVENKLITYMATIHHDNMVSLYMQHSKEK
jgi:hypothetical protein